MTERVSDLVPGLVRGHKADGRCVYDRTAKRELVKRCLQPGVSVAGMALAHGVNANLLRKWITVAVRVRSARGKEAITALVPVKVREEGALIATARGSESVLEVVLPAGTLRLSGTVSRQTLEALIDCLSRRS
jgi:transposase-like protein